MPYPLEKGLFPLLIEDFFNKGLENSAATDPPGTILDQPGPRARLRAIWRYGAIAKQLRSAGESAAKERAIEDVTPANSFIYSSLFTTPGSPELAAFQRVIAEDWFGMKWAPNDGRPKGNVPEKNNGWKRPLTSGWQASKSIGHWSGYYGNAELIVVESLQRMLEVSLGLEHQTKFPAKGKEAAFEKALREKATRVWPVCMFLSCPQPWFGSWVTWQCHDQSSAVRGQVTVLLLTPGHSRPLAPSPIDFEGDQRLLPTNRPNPYYLTGRDNVPGNSGYDGKYVDAAKAVQGSDPNTADGLRGMWLVTHENHDSTIVWSNFREPRAANWRAAEAWELPPIATYRCAPLGQRSDLQTSTPAVGRLEGYYDIVVVAPASLDGGIP